MIDHLDFVMMQQERNEDNRWPDDMPEPTTTTAAQPETEEEIAAWHGKQ